MAHLDYTLILAVCSLLALTRALYGAMSSSERVAWFAASALTAAALLFNIGRSGQLGFVVGLGVLLLRWAFDASLRIFAVTIVLAVVGVIAVWVRAPPAVQRMSAARHELRAAAVDNDYQSNIGGRLAATVVAARIVREHPLLGAASVANIPLFRQLLDTEFQDFKSAIYWYRHFHNQYAQMQANSVWPVSPLLAGYSGFWSRGPIGRGARRGSVSGRLGLSGGIPRRAFLP